MRLAPFSSIEVGEVDNFAFNITTEVGDAYIVYSIWSCSIQAGSCGSDPSAQSRIIELSNPTFVDVRLPNNTVQRLFGAFAVAQFGPCPSSAAGANYILDAQSTLSDGRTVANNAIVKCVNPGEF